MGFRGSEVQILSSRPIEKIKASVGRLFYLVPVIFAVTGSGPQSLECMKDPSKVP